MRKEKRRGRAGHLEQSHKVSTLKMVKGVNSTISFAGSKLAQCVLNMRCMTSISSLLYSCAVRRGNREVVRSAGGVLKGGGCEEWGKPGMKARVGIKGREPG